MQRVNTDVCRGKRGYENKNKAMMAAVSLNHRKGGAKADPYFCKECGQFHIGRLGGVHHKSGDNDMNIHASVKELAAKAIGQQDKSAANLSWFSQRVLRGKQGVFSELATITPDIAKHILDYNDDNRKINQRLVNQIASDIKSGFWQVNGEAIIIAKDGHLNDGQHRLNAVVQSGASIKTIVIFGVYRESRFTVDMGKARSAADFLGMNGIKYETIAAPIAQMLFNYRKGFYRSVGQHGSAREAPLTKQMIVAEYDAHEKEILAACRFVYQRKFCARHGGSAIGLAYLLCRRKSPTDADFFFDGMATGEELKRGSPILALRNRLIEERQNRLRSHERLELILRYWNAWRENRTIKVRLPLRREYPVIV